MTTKEKMVKWWGNPLDDSVPQKPQMRKVNSMLLTHTASERQ